MNDILSQIIAYAPNKIDTETKAQALAIGPRAMVGEITDEQTQFGKPIYQTPAGEKVSEKSTTLFFNGNWMNVPSIHGGKSFNEDELRLMIKQGNLQPTSVHKSKADAEAAAEARSNSMVQGPRNMADGGRIPFGKGGDVEGLRTYLKSLPEGAEINVKKLSDKYKVSRSTVTINRQNLRPDLKVVFNLPGTKGSGALQEGVLQAYKELGKGKNTTTIDIYNKIKDLDPFNNYNRRDLLTIIGKRLKMNNKPFKKTAGATSDAAEETKQAKRKIYLDKKVNQPTIVYQVTEPGKPGKIMNIKFPEKGNLTKANFKKAIENYYSMPKDDAKIKVAKNKLIKDFFPDGITNPQWDKLVNFFTQDEGIDTKRPYKYGDEDSQKISRDERKSRKEIYSDKIFEDRISDEKRNIIKDKGLLKNLNFKAGYEPIDLAHRLSLASSERFNIPQRTGTIGLDRPVVNQVFVEYYQSKLNKVYNLQKELIENKPKNWRKRLEAANKLITSIVNDADNRIVGVMIDEITLKPKLFGDKLAAKYAIDQGLFDTEIQKLKPKDKEFIKKFLVEEQVMREVDTGLDVRNFRNINKDSITKWMNKKKRFKNTEIQKQALKILEDNPQITKSYGVLGTKDSQPQVKKLLQDFEKYGCGLAAGGRILFSEGTPGGKPTKCAQAGIRKFITDLKTGNYTQATKNLLKGGGALVRNILNPMELLKLRNYFGPAALGFMAAFEGGVITDDVIRQGTPLNESLANNWLTKSFVPYTQTYAQAKNLLETGKVPSNMKKYVQDTMNFQDVLMDMKAMENKQAGRLVDQGGYGMLDGTSMYTKEDELKDQDKVMEKMKTISENVFLPGSAKELEMKSLIDEMEATRMAKKGFSPLFGFDKLKDRNQEVVFDDYMSPVEIPKDLRPITYMDAEYEDQRLPLELEQKYMNLFGLKPRDNLSNYFYKDSERNVLEELTDEYNKFKRQEMASQYPGYYGTQDDREFNFMEGGIASLNVKKR